MKATVLLFLLLELASARRFTRGSEVAPAALCKRTIASVEMLDDGKKVLFKFEDKGPSIAFGVANPDTSTSLFTNALATVEDEPSHVMDDCATQTTSLLKRGYKKVAHASFHVTRRALRMDLQDAKGATRRLFLFCAQTLDDVSVNGFDPVMIQAF